MDDGSLLKYQNNANTNRSNLRILFSQLLGRQATSVDTATSLRAKETRDRNSNPRKCHKICAFCERWRPKGKSGRDVKLIIHSKLVSNLRMSGVLPPLGCMPTCIAKGKFCLILLPTRTITIIDQQ